MMGFRFKVMDVEVIVLGMGTPKGDYPGEFTPQVQSVIHYEITGYAPILHLFSGSSKIGKVRVDIDHPHATHHMDVVTFTEQDDTYWAYTILDPPYAIERKEKKLLGYGMKDGIGGNTAMRRAVEEWAPGHTWRILWLDQCAPMPPGFKRVRLYLLLPGSYKNVRVLSLLENTQMEAFQRRTLDTFFPSRE